MAAAVTGCMALTGATPMVAVWWYRKRVQGELDPGVELPIRSTACCLAAWAVFVFGRASPADFAYFAF
jgi:hypothetical protein